MIGRDVIDQVRAQLLGQLRQASDPTQLHRLQGGLNVCDIFEQHLDAAPVTRLREEA